MKLLIALALLSTGQHAFASNQACGSGAVINPGTMVVDCTISKASENWNPQKLHFEVTDKNRIGGFNIEVPASVAHPEDFSSLQYEYSVAAVNSSGDCLLPATQQLMLILRESEPFCNPPVLGGDSGRQTCAFPKDPERLSSKDLKPVKDGQRLKISAQNSRLGVSCSAQFSETKRTASFCQHLSERECAADSECTWIKTSYPACYPKGFSSAELRSAAALDERLNCTYNGNPFSGVEDERVCPAGASERCQKLGTYGDGACYCCS